jgi:Tfp pilus assembly protein PilV
MADDSASKPAMRARPPTWTFAAGTRPRGITLIEALVAMVVLALAAMAVIRLHGVLRVHADFARQRSDAARIAQRDIESLRAFSTLPATGAAPSHAFDDIAADSRDADDPLPTRYRIERLVRAEAGGRLLAVSTAVHWSGRDGRAQRLALDTAIARVDPALAAALAVAPAGVPALGALGAFGRSVHVPLAAKDLGDGRSAFKPREDGGIAFVLDNISGQIVALCEQATPTRPTASLDLAALGACTKLSGLLLSGYVRFAAASSVVASPAAASPAATSSADPSRTDTTPLPLEIALALQGGSYPREPLCIAAPLDDDADRAVRYHCLVPVRADGRWSGRSSVVPQGWRIGTGAGEYRVCRYSADLDGSGAVDRNVEHPARYENVDAALAQQNFLVVAGPDACPAPGTVQHQP